MSKADDYIAARAEFVRQDDRLDQIARNIRSVAEELTNSRPWFSFSNVGPGMPPEVIVSPRAKNADRNSWPDAKHINACLAEWHQAKKTMLERWGSIDHALQGGLVAPPEKARR